MEEDSADDGLILGEDVCFDDETLAHNGPGGEAAGFDFGAHAFDDDALRKLPGCRAGTFR